MKIVFAFKNSFSIISLISKKKLLQSSDYEIFVKMKWKRAILFSWQCIVNTVLSNFPGLLQKHIMAEVLSKHLVSQSVSIFNLSSKASN